MKISKIFILKCRFTRAKTESLGHTAQEKCYAVHSKKLQLILQFIKCFFVKCAIQHHI